jgi:hypothetical protein
MQTPFRMGQAIDAISHTQPMLGKMSSPILPKRAYCFSWEEIFFPEIDSGLALCSTHGLLGLNIEYAKRATAPRVVDHA